MPGKATAPVLKDGKRFISARHQQRHQQRRQSLYAHYPASEYEALFKYRQYRQGTQSVFALRAPSMIIDPRASQIGTGLMVRGKELAAAGGQVLSDVGAEGAHMYQEEGQLDCSTVS
jgi:hypothetical protein